MKLRVLVLNNRTRNAMMCGVVGCDRSGEDNIKGPDEEREEEFATGPLSLLMQVSTLRFRESVRRSTHWCCRL